MSSTSEDELARFREEWQAEVLRKRKQVDSLQSQPVINNVDNPVPELPVQGKPAPSLQPPPQPGPSQSATFSSSHTSHGISSTFSRPLRSAIDIYRSAVQLEQRSQLDEALNLYRQAFRMDSNVDKAYHKEEKQLQAVILASEAVFPNHEHTSGDASSAAVQDLASGVGALGIKHGGSASGCLAGIVQEFPDTLSFKSEHEGEPVPISLLPDELLVFILRILDHSTIERFATVSRKARVLTLDSAIWRSLVQLTYKPPQIPDEDHFKALLERYNLDFRRIFIEYPRVRLDGVYIAVCHYIRPGLSENAWVNMSHLITYHRYLRFSANGQVLSLLTNEEMEPKQVIPLLKPSLRMKGLFIGTWKLIGTNVEITDLFDASGKYPYPPSPPEHTPVSSTDPPPEMSRYAFQMMLSLRSRPLGRWNKLDIIEYDSINTETNEVIPLALKHERPFWFSKVRSWSIY